MNNLPIERYTYITGQSPEELSNAVNTRIATHNFRPIGNPVLYKLTSLDIWYQFGMESAVYAYKIPARDKESIANMKEGDTIRLILDVPPLGVPEPYWGSKR